MIKCYGKGNKKVDTQNITKIIEGLEQGGKLTFEAFKMLMTAGGDEKKKLMRAARACADKVYGKDIYIRGLIEFTNYCKNDCFYCGIRKSNSNAERYRLTKEQIMDCCRQGYELGFRTFVLQGGEDAYYTDERVCDMVSEIKRRYQVKWCKPLTLGTICTATKPIGSSQTR